MDWRRRVPGGVRKLGRQGLSFGANAAVRTNAAVRAGRPVPGLLSFIVPVYNVEKYLDECLVSLRFQSYRNIEIICVDDGTPDQSVAIVRRHRLKDPRVRLVRRPNGGLSAARNTGVAAARGEFIAFVDSDDTVPPDGYREAAESLKASGSDFAVLPYQRVKGGVVVPPAPWIRAIHTRPRVGVNIDEFPDALANAIMCSKVFRRDFWTRCGLRFVEGIIYEDQQVSAEAYARARSFDVLTTMLYNWRIRLDRSSISQAKREVENLRAQFAAANESLDVLRRFASERVVTERVLQLLSNDMPQFTGLLVGASDDFWDLVRGELPVLVDPLDPEDYYARVPPQQKVLQHLIMTDRRAQAEEFIKRGGLTIRDARLSEEPVGLVVHLPFWRDPEVPVPDELFRVAERQTRARTSVRALEVLSDHELRVRAWAFVENVDLAGQTPRVRAFAVAPGHDDVELEVETGTDPAIDELELPGSGYADYRNGAITVHVDVARLGVAPWQVRVDLSSGGLERSAVLGAVWDSGTAAVRHVLRDPAGRPVVAGSRRGRVLVVEVYDDGVAASDVALAGDVLTLSGEGPVPDRVALHGRTGPLATAVPERAGEGWSAGFDTGALRRTSETAEHWTFTAQVSGSDVPVRFAPQRPTTVRDSRDPRLFVSVTQDGRLRAQLSDRTAVVRAAELTEQGVVLRLDVHGLEPAEHRAIFESAPATSEGRITADGPGSWTVLFPFEETRWGREGQLVRSGSYEVALEHTASGTRVVPRVAGGLLAGLPVDEVVGRVRCQLRLRPWAAQLQVVIGPPLPPECRGMRNQLALQARANHGRADEHSVFFRSLYGEVANDSAAAVHHELRRRGSDLTLYWSVQDYSVDVPEGGVPLLEGTPEWHERLGAARFVMLNVHQPMWYRKPVGQVMVQTFHGYPYKGMGQQWWRRSNLPEARITSFLDRAEEWDHLVSPAAYATPRLLEAFFRPEAAAAVNVLEIGYPRNDILLNDEGKAVRERTRAALGIGPDQTAVLYGPTFRDYLSSDGMTAKGVDFFDPAAAAAALGPSYVVLVRGHAFNARAGEARVSAERVVDVTYYPDVTDLCLASDAAVLDYSSLRFDYALLRRPMVFLVPDEEEYHTNRPAILPYRETAPGPHVATTAEVVRALRDLDGTRRRHADEVERFIATYLEREDGRATERLVDAVFAADETEG